MCDYSNPFLILGRVVTIPLESTVLNCSSEYCVFSTTAVGTRWCSSGLRDFGTTTVDFGPKSLKFFGNRRFWHHCRKNAVAVLKRPNSEEWWADMAE